MLKRLVISAAGLCLISANALAQAPANTLTQATKAQFGFVKTVVAKTAEKVPESLYEFRPTPEVRTIAQLLGHIADAQFMMCSAAAGEKPPQSDIEKSMTTKAQLSKAVADANAYCDKVLDGMDDKKGAEIVQFFTGPMPRLSVLTFNVAHSYEHYGNLVTYMRLKGIVPPSSEQQTR